jgi:hypothetical protein
MLIYGTGNTPFRTLLDARVLPATLVAMSVQVVPFDEYTNSSALSPVATQYSPFQITDWPFVKAGVVSLASVAVQAIPSLDRASVVLVAPAGDPPTAIHILPFQAMLLHSFANGVPKLQDVVIQFLVPSISVEYIILVSEGSVLTPPMSHCLPFQATHRPLVKVFETDTETGVQVVPFCDVAIILLPVTAFPVAKNTVPFQATPYPLARIVEHELGTGVQLIPSYE